MPPPDDPTDDASTRFRALLISNQARWTGIARAYASTSDRDDLVQEIALQVWRSLPGYAGAAKIDTWAYRVALNTALAWRRKAATRSAKLKQSNHDVAEVADASSGGATDEGRVTALLDRFLASLNEADRAVMLLHLDGLGPDEAAEVLGVTPGAYRTRLHRVRLRFEQDFSQREDER